MEQPCLSEAMRTELCACQLSAISFRVQSPHLTEKETEIFREESDGSHLGSLAPQSRVLPIVPASARSKVFVS